MELGKKIMKLVKAHHTAKKKKKKKKKKKIKFKKKRKNKPKKVSYVLNHMLHKK
jgi:hypothetical protein